MRGEQTILAESPRTLADPSSN